MSPMVIVAMWGTITILTSIGAAIGAVVGAAIGGAAGSASGSVVGAAALAGSANSKTVCVPSASS